MEEFLTENLPRLIPLALFGIATALAGLWLGLKAMLPACDVCHGQGEPLITLFVDFRVVHACRDCIGEIDAVIDQEPSR